MLWCRNAHILKQTYFRRFKGITSRRAVDTSSKYGVLENTKKVTNYSASFELVIFRLNFLYMQKLKAFSDF